MKKINFNYDETVFEEKLPNGLIVYLYPTNKTKNFYITVSTHFGAEVMKYQKGKTTYEITKGSAHFLEHRVMDFTKNKEAMKKINEYGSLVNAYTTYNGTNYNIFGHEKILENMTLLFDCVFKANIKDEDVEKERGIILEEYYMYNDDPYYKLHNNLNKNIFTSSFLKYPVLGTKEGIEEVSGDELRRLYNDFYTPENMFIVVTGNFNKNEVLDFIKEYTKNIKKSTNKIKVITTREKCDVPCEYEESVLPVAEPKVIVGYKIKKTENINEIKYKTILGMLLNNTFGSVGECYEELNNLGIKRTDYGMETSTNYIMIYFKASTNQIEDFLNIIEKHFNNLSLNKTDLERKKRGSISSLVLAFEDIIDVEDRITTDLLTYKKLINNRDEIVNNITLKDIKDVTRDIKTNTKSVFIIKKEQI